MRRRRILVLVTAALLTAAALAAVAVAAARGGGPPPAAEGGPPSTGIARQGYHLYGRFCSACHGANGEGTAPAQAGTIGFGPGRAARTQTALAPSLHGVGARAADFYLTTGYMPLQHVGEQPHRQSPLPLTGPQIRAIVAYVATLGGPPVPAPDPARGSVSQGQQLFTANCAGCHQVAVQGGYVTGAVAWPLEKATPTQIAEAVRIGPYVMPKFSRKQISDRQLDSIIAYVQYAKDPPDYGGWGIGHIGPVPEGLIAWFLGGTVLVGTCIVIGKRLRRGGS